MSDVVVSVVESNTAVTVTEQDVAVDVTENNVVVSVSTAGIQGVPGANNDPTYVTVRNATGATLAKGTIVYISGANGNNVQVSPALATGDSTSARTIGWLAASIPNNGSGLCMVEGYLEGLNTQGFTAGAQLYLSGTVAGAFTATKPQAPIHLVYVGVVTKVSAGDGHVFVKVQNGYEISELHDVLIVAPTNNQVLAYDSATQLWKNATNTPDGVTSITATAPLTGGTITSTGSIGLDQTALSITKSQVSDFTSGTVTSAGTAQQAGTAVYSVNSGTAVYATTSGTAVSISGDITKSQVSDFTSGTVASAGTAQQSGTAVFANTSGTATYATTSGTATYATNAGTAVFATNASTAVTISGSITQSQVTNLTTDLAGKANLAGGNALTGAQTITSTAIGQVPLTLVAASGQTANLLATAGGARIPAAGNYFIAPGITASYAMDVTAGAIGVTPLNVSGASGQTANLQNWNNGGVIQASIGPFGNATFATGGTVYGRLSVNTGTTGTIGAVIRGVASQSANLLEIQSSAGTILSRFSSSGQLVTDQQTYIGSGAPGIANSRLSVTTASASVIGAVIKGASGQTANLLELQDSTSAVKLYANASGDMSFGSLGLGFVTPYSSYGNSLLSISTVGAANKGLVIRGVSGQTADLLQVQDSAGNNNVSVSPTFGLVGRNAGNLSYAISSGAGLAAFYSQAATNVLMTLRGAASQSGNLQEWQSSGGTVEAMVTSGGFVRANRIATWNQFLFGAERNSGGELTFTKETAATTNPGANLARLYFRDGTTAGTLKLVVRAGATGAETTILDNIPT
jgi:hypothetical protein